MRIFKTQLDAATYLREQGYKVSKSQFNRDVLAGKVAKNADGHFEEPALMGYAGVNLTPLQQHDNSMLNAATVGRIEADAKLKSYAAERARVKLEKELGQIMPKAQHYQELAARALFFRSEIESFCRRKGGEIIAIVHGDENYLPDLLRWWESATADWIDAWAADRTFTAGDGDEDEENAGADDENQGGGEGGEHAV